MFMMLQLQFSTGDTLQAKHKIINQYPFTYPIFSNLLYSIFKYAVLCVRNICHLQYFIRAIKLISYFIIYHIL